MANVDVNTVNTLCKEGTDLFFVKKKTKSHSDSTKKFSETYIINMFEILIDNILAMFSGRVFQQTVSIHIGTSVRILLRRGVVDTTLCDKVC